MTSYPACPSAHLTGRTINDRSFLGSSANLCAFIISPNALGHSYTRGSRNAALKFLDATRPHPRMAEGYQVSLLPLCSFRDQDPGLITVRFFSNGKYIVHQFEVAAKVVAVVKNMGVAVPTHDKHPGLIL